MRLYIKSSKSIPIILWIPINCMTIRLSRRFIEKTNADLSFNQLLTLVKVYRSLKKIHRHLLLIDVKSSNGDVVRIWM
jgi:hypothetical protein